MSDLISRQMVLDLCHNHINGTVDANDIARLPSAEKIGHWILDETDNSVKCDKCGCNIYPNDIMFGEPHYCPNCGAKMVDPQERSDKE